MQTASSKEKRSVARRRVVKAAKIAFGDFVFVRDCSLHNISAVGARINVGSGAHEIPDEFWLVLAADRLMRRVHVVWRKGNDFGVEFEPEIRNLMTDEDPRLRQFRYL